MFLNLSILTNGSVKYRVYNVEFLCGQVVRRLNLNLSAFTMLLHILAHIRQDMNPVDIVHSTNLTFVQDLCCDQY